MKKYFWRILFLLILLGWLFFLNYFFILVLKNIFKFNFKPAVIFFDVGQGDAILIRLPSGENILIDGGPDNYVLQKLGKELPYFSRQLDFIFLSHYHDDHSVGLVELVKRYSVANIFYSKDSPKRITISLFLETAANYFAKSKFSVGAKNIYPFSGETNLNFEKDCSLFILDSNSLGVSDCGNNSLIQKLSCKGQTFLFSGDNELEVENALLKTNFNLRADVFKASHHGSKTSNSEDFLKMVSPKTCVILVGENNRFNHPSQETLELLEYMNIETLRTDISGDIFFYF